jgi:hypothetical protein
MSHNRLVLEFFGVPPELFSTRFVNHSGEMFVSLRGKNQGAIAGAGSFQWSAAVRAFSLLMVKAARAVSVGDSLAKVNLTGGQGSLASSLDYALVKQPDWALDMFGFDIYGQSYLRCLLRRTNSERKMPGPVIIGLNPNALIGSVLEIKVNGLSLTHPEQLTYLVQDMEESLGVAIKPLRYLAA